MASQAANLTIDFDRDIHEAVLQALPHDPARAAELQAMSSSDLLVTYINWRNRLISPRCREICMSWEFSANPLRFDPTYRPALEHIIEALKTGGNVTPHLSTRVTAGFDVSAPAKLNQREDLDLLLNDWSVHHLHLSTTMQPNGFVKRTGPLLFAVVGSTLAFLVDILDHKSWSREHIAHVIINNWPNANFVHLLPNVVWGPAISEAERQQLRNAGIHSGFIEHKGKYYVIGMGGLSSAGTSIQHTRLTDVIRVGLRAFEDHVKEHPDYVSETLRLNSIPVPASLDVRFIIRSDGWFAIREENTRVLFEIPGLPKDQP